MLILVTDGANNGGEIAPITAARLAAEEGVKIYPIGIGADPEQSATLGVLGINPSLDLDEPALKELAQVTGGRYFRARDGQELQAIKQTLDQLEPVAQQPTQARPAQALYHWPLATALLLSVLLVLRERWPQNPLQRFFTQSNFLLPAHDWRQRLKRLRLRSVDDQPLAPLVPPRLVAGAAPAGAAAVEALAPAETRRALADDPAPGLSRRPAQRRQWPRKQAALGGPGPGLAAGSAGPAGPQLAAGGTDQPETRRPAGGAAGADPADARQRRAARSPGAGPAQAAGPVATAQRRADRHRGLRRQRPHPGAAVR